MKQSAPHNDGGPAVRPGATVRHCTQDEAQAWAQRWLAVYAAGGKAPGLKRYLWHTFSAGAYPCVSGADAESAYAQQDGSEIVVLANDRKAALLTDALPRWYGQADWCAFPPDLAWTMAFTHEDGWLGPYFAKHPQYAALTAQAVQRRAATQSKQQALQRARKEGWI